MWKQEGEWKIVDQERAIEILTWPTMERRLTYKEEDKVIDFFLEGGITANGDVGLIVLGPYPIQWNEGEEVSKEKASTIRENVTDAMRVIGLEIIKFSKKAHL